MPNKNVSTLLGFALLAGLAATSRAQQVGPPSDVLAEIDPSSLRGKVLCGYQGWFRCPGDASGMGWIHWSFHRDRIAPRTLSFEMWPDMREYGPTERFKVPGFTYPDGRQAELFSSDHPATILRHFTWMRDYGIDGVWMQHFAVDLRGGPSADRYESRMRVLKLVRDAAEKTGRVWALTYDLSGAPPDRILDIVTRDWKSLVDEHVVGGPRYVRERGLPVVQVWGLYPEDREHRLPLEVARDLVDFFKTPGPYQAYVVGGGDWAWRRSSDAGWQGLVARLDGYAPWNVGNYRTDRAGVRHASTSTWAEEKRESERAGRLWIPVVYPGFSWDNLKHKPAGSTTISRNGGRFLWEQFHELTSLGAESVFVAMFDEVDEATAIFKVSSTPPVQAHFLDYEGLPSDWYLRLVGEGTKAVRGSRPATPDLPISRPRAESRSGGISRP